MIKKRFTIICGHYGCGKTNLALNLASTLAQEGKNVVMADMDLVNPYFRSSDYQKETDERGIRMIAPVFAHSNVDVPSLSPEIYTTFTTKDYVILDVGGDDVGATVLGRFHQQLEALDYDMFYVVNCYRNMTMTPEEAVELLREIEWTSRCHATAIVNNSHLKDETTADTVMNSMNFAERVAKLTGLPLAATAVREDLMPELAGKIEKMYPVSVMVKTIWD